MFQETSFIAKNQESEVTMSKAPVFDSKVFINACKGPIYFGHIHSHVSIKNHIHYSGSFSRFKFGEEEDKGWYLNVYDVTTNRYVHEFVKNKGAQKYTTILVNIVSETDPETLAALIDNALETEDYIKMKIVIKEDVDCSYMISYLNEKYQKNTAVKIEVKNDFELQKDVIKDQKVDEIWKEYEFLFDDGLTHEEKIQKFIKVKHNREVPIEIIKDQLNLL
jgi:DNA repair exonuclease SbcCD nuclease subunit